MTELRAYSTILETHVDEEDELGGVRRWESGIAPVDAVLSGLRLDSNECFIRCAGYVSVLASYGMVAVYVFDFLKDLHVTACTYHTTWVDQFLLWWSLFSPITLVYVLFAHRDLC